MIKRIIFLLSILLIFHFNLKLLCAYDKVGTTSAQFLKIDSSARSAAMGSTFVGIADDINSIYWNPSGLSNLTFKEVSFMCLFHFEEFKYNFLSYAHPTERMGTFGFMLIYATSGDIPKTLVNEWGGYVETKGTFVGKDLAFLLSYGNIYSEHLFQGLNIKVIQQEIDTKKAIAYAFDYGILYKVPIYFKGTEKCLKIGFNLSNIGTELKFIETKEKLPLNIRVGTGFDLTPSCILGLDINKPIDNDYNLHIGFERTFKNLFSIRGGYKTDLISELGSSSGFTLGFGCQLKLAGIDYAFVPYGDLGMSHRISLNFKFGKKKDLTQGFQERDWWE